MQYLFIQNDASASVIVVLILVGLVINVMFMVFISTKVLGFKVELFFNRLVLEINQRIESLDEEEKQKVVAFKQAFNGIYEIIKKRKESSLNQDL